MNRRQKTVLLIASSLLLVITITFLLYPGFLTSIIYFIYFGLIVILAFIFILAFTDAKSENKVKGPYDDANQILFSARSVFPFQIFPDKYFIQEKTISIVRKEFFSQGWVETIAIRDIGGIRMYTGPFFSSIVIIRKILPQTTVEMRNIWKNDAFKMKQLLDGLMMTENNLVDLPSQISLKTEKKILTEIGREKEVEKEI